MDSPPITREKIDELLRFLPTLGSPGPETEPVWRAAVDAHAEEGVIPMHFPSYPDVVIEFFKLAQQEWWNDSKYEPIEAMRMVNDDRVIASASLDQIKTMLTVCARGERYCDGYWADMVRQGRIGAILRRLGELRDEVPESQPRRKPRA